MQSSKDCVRLQDALNASRRLLLLSSKNAEVESWSETIVALAAVAGCYITVIDSLL